MTAAAPAAASSCRCGGRTAWASSSGAGYFGPFPPHLPRGRLRVAAAGRTGGLRRVEPVGDGPGGVDVRSGAEADGSPKGTRTLAGRPQG
ncbi:hypothetical protein GCM10023238_39670 [Streptomyces heliomycini]